MTQASAELGVNASGQEIAARANPVTCTITYDQRPWTWLDACTVTGHELRHLDGYRHPVGYEGDVNHSPNPRSLMYPVLLRTWPPCRPGALGIAAPAGVGLRL